MTFLFLGLKVSFFTHDYKKNLNLMGRDEWDGNQKCPLKFFILCGYID